MCTFLSTWSSALTNQPYCNSLAVSNMEMFNVHRTRYETESTKIFPPSCDFILLCSGLLTHVIKEQATTGIMIWFTCTLLWTLAGSTEICK